MRIRFLQLVESEKPGFPFVPGQIIDLAEPPTSILRWVDGVHAEALHTEPLAAVVDAGERAVMPSARRGRSHAH